MFSDVETVRQWTRVALTIAAVPVTAFPLLYLVFSRWYKSQLGRAMMLQSLAIAFAIDFSLIYQYWAFTSNFLALLTVRFYIFVCIGLAEFYLTGMLAYYLLKSLKERSKNVERRSGNSDQGPVPQ